MAQDSGWSRRSFEAVVGKKSHMRGSYPCKYIFTSNICNAHYHYAFVCTNSKMMIKTMLIQICILVILVEKFQLWGFWFWFMQRLIWPSGTEMLVWCACYLWRWCKRRAWDKIDEGSLFSKKFWFKHHAHANKFHPQKYLPRPYCRNSNGWIIFARITED